MTAHENRLGYTNDDDGVWLICSCGERMALGYDSSLEDAAEAFDAHLVTPEPEVALPFEVKEGEFVTRCYKCDGPRILGTACINGCFHPASPHHLETSECCPACRGEL